MTNVFKKQLILLLKKIEVGSAFAVRLTQLTKKSKLPIHPKHFLTQKPWFIKYLTSKDLVIDIGSGNGQNAIKAARVAKKVIGLEINESLIKIAKQSAKNNRVKNIFFKKTDLEKDINIKNRFDKVLFLDVLEHLEKRDKILVEIKKLLKSNGHLFLGVPNSQTSWKRSQRSVGINSYSDPDHKIEYSEPQIKNFLKKHDFKIIHFGYAPADTPFRGFYDIIGGISISLYKKIHNWRYQKAQRHHQESSGFEIVAQKK